MKKIGTLTIFALLFLSVLSARINATEELPTIVNGHIYASDGKTPVASATVEVACGTPENKILDTTDANGYYVVEFLDTEACKTGDTVWVTSGGVTETGTVANRILIKNIVYVNLSVPEFGAIAALVALVGSVLVFSIIRKKQ